MSDDLVIQGIATQLEKPFTHGDDILILKSGCFDTSLRGANDIKLLLNHDPEHCLGSSKDGRLLIHAGEKELVFRFLIGKADKLFSDIADDIESYFPISIGYVTTKTEMEVVDGVSVKSIVEADLREISILNNAPAIHSTYGRVTKW